MHADRKTFPARFRNHGEPTAIAALGLMLAMASPTFAQADDVPAEAASETATTSSEDSKSLEKPPSRLVEPILITATRRKQSVFDVPAFADVVTQKDIEEAMYRTLPEALRDVPGLMIQKTSLGQGSPYIRGFTGFRNLMLIDGIRLNNSVYREGPNQYWNTVDLYSVRQLEVVKGPSSVLYGSDAIGGTVNAITKGPTAYGEGMQFGGMGAYRVSSAERSHTGRGEMNVTWNDTFGVYGGLTYQDFGDLETGAGRNTHTGYEDWGGDAKVEYYLNPDTKFVLAYQHFDLDDAMRTHSTIYARPFHDTTVGSDLRRQLDQTRDLGYMQFHAENIDSFIDTMRVSVSLHSQEEMEDRIRSDGRRDKQGFDVNTYGVWAQFESPSPIGRWTYGIEYYRDEVDSFRRTFAADGTSTGTQIQGPVGDNASYDLLGIYVQNDIPITDSLNLIVGGRFTYANAEADRVQDPETGEAISISEEFDSVVGSARLMLRLDEAEHWHLFGGVSQGFRAPNLSDLTRLDIARSDEIETPSPDLEPEDFISYEIGFKTTYENFAAQVSYFYTDIDGMIIRQPTGRIIDGLREVTKRNGGDGYVQGVEFGASWGFHPNMTVFGSFAWMEGDLDTYPTSDPVLVREPLSRVMPTTGQIGLRWDSNERNLFLEGVVTIAADADRLNTADEADTQRIPPGGTPGYTVFSIRSGWRINNNFSLNFVVDNVTNEDYRIHGSGVNEPGRNFILGVECRF